MKTPLFTILLLILSSLFFANCGNNADFRTLLAERDSLIEINRSQDEELSQLNKTVSTINQIFDSIAHQEGLIFINSDGKELTNKQDIFDNLDRYSQVVKNQHEKIAKLQAQLEDDSENEEIAGMIEHLQNQIATKDREIANLRSELSKKNVDIARLRKQVLAQQETIEEHVATIDNLGRINKGQTEALKRQDEMLNQCYVAIGTKKDLQKQGIIKKNKLVSQTALDKNKFMRVDIRNFREITFNAKRPKIITSMPQSAYIITTTGNNNFTLKISNPTDFWRISNYLVIQTD